jgi:hypothetical protein
MINALQSEIIQETLIVKKPYTFNLKINYVHPAVQIFCFTKITLMSQGNTTVSKIVLDSQQHEHCRK